MKSIAILGSTGSIGRQTLEVVESLPGRFRVAALAAGNNVELLAQQTARHQPELVSAGTARAADQLRERLLSARVSPLPEIQWGSAGMTAVATHPGAQMLVSAAVGVVGLPATFAAVKQGKQIALANKEVLVAAGELVTAAAREKNVELLPVDSEHNAIHQCLRAGQRNEVRRIYLTASGGPFRKTPLKKLAHVTVEQALAHPNWRMGNRITVDSATMMNKGFEVIEARWLFGLPLEQIEVVVHPQSIVHSLVEFADGSTLAQLGPPDMRIPIQYALMFPERVAGNTRTLDWATIKRLDFERPSARRFPCLQLAREALRRGGAWPCALNAADEVAVAAFLERRIPFTGIARVIEAVLNRLSGAQLVSMEDVLHWDAEARRLAAEEVNRACLRVGAAGT